MLVKFLDGSEKEFESLHGADLRGADLQYADLQDSDLQYANLRYANLQYADLQYADLQFANLQYANLRGANLQYADFQYANLRYANLHNIKPSNDSHDLISAILFQCAGNNIEKQMIAGLIFLRRDLCWKDFLILSHPQKDWAIQTLKDKGFVSSDVRKILNIPQMNGG